MWNKKRVFSKMESVFVQNFLMDSIQDGSSINTCRQLLYDNSFRFVTYMGHSIMVTDLFLSFWERQLKQNCRKFSDNFFTDLSLSPRWQRIRCTFCWLLHASSSTLHQNVIKFFWVFRTSAYSSRNNLATKINKRCSCPASSFIEGV